MGSNLLSLLRLSLSLCALSLLCSQTRSDQNRTGHLTFNSLCLSNGGTVPSVFPGFIASSSFFAGSELERVQPSCSLIKKHQIRLKHRQSEENVVLFVSTYMKHSSSLCCCKLTLCLLLFMCVCVCSP